MLGTNVEIPACVHILYIISKINTNIAWFIARQWKLSCDIENDNTVLCIHSFFTSHVPSYLRWFYLRVVPLSQVL